MIKGRGWNDIKFTEEKLEQAIIALLEDQGYPHQRGDTITRASGEVLIKSDLQALLASQYAGDRGFSISPALKTPV